MSDQGQQEMDRLMRQYFGDRHPDARAAVTTDSPLVRQFALALVSDSLTRGLGKSFQRCLDDALAYCQGSTSKPGLRLVTAENAAQFAPAPKRRGRPRKVVIEGNVVAFRRPEPPVLSEYERQELRLAQALIARQVRRGAPVLSVDRALEVIRTVVANNREDWEDGA